MGTEHDLDALTCPPIDALNQGPRHPQSLPAAPWSESRHQLHGTLRVGRKYLTNPTIVVNA
jgi:hypothetical protein